MLGAAKRTLDGEDRSEIIADEGKAGRKIGERWSAILVPSPAASNRSRWSPTSILPIFRHSFYRARIEIIWPGGQGFLRC